MSEIELAKSKALYCPDCGGRMKFSPAQQQLCCPYCGALRAFDVERDTPNEFDIAFPPPRRDAAWGDELRVLSCDGCGARLVLTGETALPACPFCGAQELQPTEGSGIAPENVIPFRLTRTQARDALCRWFRHRPFAWRKARRLAMNGGLCGVYLSQWAYLEDATSVYQGKAGRHYKLALPVTVTDADGKERQEARERQLTRWEAAEGTVVQSFDDLLIQASGRLTEPEMDGVLPYKLHHMRKYGPGYIAGYAVEQPDIDPREGWQVAQSLSDRRLAALAERQILVDADEAKVERLSTEHKRIRYKLVLLPAYLCSLRRGDRTWRVLINGESGKVSGKVPLGRVKLLVTVLLGLMLIGLAVWLLIRFNARYAIHE